MVRGFPEPRSGGVSVSTDTAAVSFQASTRYRLSVDEPFRPFAKPAYRTVRNGVRAALRSSSLSAQFALVVPVLLTGARGSGKASLVKHVAEGLGVHLVEVSETFRRQCEQALIRIEFRWMGMPSSAIPTLRVKALFRRP